MCRRTFMGERVEFFEVVKRTLAQRVNNRCSNPTCGAPTSGPQVDPQKSLNVGVAAHVTAASPGGPRYNPGLTEEQRGSANNGIWLCQTCAKLIDNDEIRFSEELICHWKQFAEQRALDQIGRRFPFDKTYNPQVEWLGPTGGVPTSPVLFGQTREELLQELISDSLRSDFGQSFHHAELLAEGQGALGQRYAVVGVASNSGWDWTILLFDAGEFGWELMAKIAVDGQKARVPEVSYVRGTPGALALTHVHGYGTGVFRRSTSWYRISRGDPFSFLSYPESFHVHGWGMPFGRTLTSSAVKLPPALSPGAELSLLFTIKYDMFTSSPQNGAFPPLFSKSERLSLEWVPEARTFLPSTSNDDFSKIEEFWEDDTTRFIAHNIEQLLFLAKSGSPQQKDFIREHLFPAARPDLQARIKEVMA